MQPSVGSEIGRLLRDAGWFPSRRLPEAVARWRSALEAEGFVLHPAAEAVLVEFGGLHVGSMGPGVEMARSEVCLDPSLAVGERERFAELRGRQVFPLGEVDGGNGFLGVDRAGAVYLVAEEVLARWPSFEAALRSLVTGTRGAEA
jgi:hypothetical protein